jgi:hypothetical protein
MGWGIGLPVVGELGEPLGGAPDRRQVAVVEITDFDTVVEQHPVPQPVETVGQNDLALRACGYTGVEVDGGLDPVADLQVDLACVGLGQGVRLPVGHRHSLPDGRADR